MGPTASPPKSSCVCAALERIRLLHFAPKPRSEDYPPFSAIPRTSPDRLDRATPKRDAWEGVAVEQEEQEQAIPSSSPLAAPYLSDPSSSTVLYLAYGSNLCAEVFLGRRGIRPVSAVNVSVPSLRLTFDLPGVAYREPCFANTAPRKIPKPPKVPPGLPDPPEIPHPPPGFSLPPGVSPPRPSSSSATARGDVGTAGAAGGARDGAPQWDAGLVGVVYEVTPEDYATIIRTEGGGASYQDILVPCIPITAKPPGIPERPPVPGLPRPFLAHTLYAPRIPKRPDEGGGDGDGDDKKGVLGARDGDGDGDGDGDDKNPLDKLKDWWRKLLLEPVRPDPEYAQPSARYLKLLVDGAAEHDLPADYQRYLASLQPYTITTRRQYVGQFLLLSLVTPVMLLYLTLSMLLGDENGRVPVWLALVMETFSHLAWGTYDRWFKPTFGDGERTSRDDEDEKDRSIPWERQPVGDEEKLGLLDR